MVILNTEGIMDPWEYPSSIYSKVNWHNQSGNLKVKIHKAFTQKFHTRVY